MTGGITGLLRSWWWRRVLGHSKPPWHVVSAPVAEARRAVKHTCTFLRHPQESSINGPMTGPLILTIAIALRLAQFARATEIDPADIRAIDGDTIRVHHNC
jgi:hypothetical protein